MMASWFQKKAHIDNSDKTESKKNDIDDFVFIVKSSDSTSSMKDKENSSDDYEDLYQFLNSAQVSNSMGQPASKQLQENDVGNSVMHLSSAFNGAMDLRRSSIISVAPHDSTNNVTEPTYESGAYLAGVPFRLSSSFNCLRIIKQFEQESFAFLHTENILDRLQYDFKTEQQVIGGAI